MQPRDDEGERRVVDQQQHDHPAEDAQAVLPGAELLLADPRQVGDRDLRLAQAPGLRLDPDLGLDVEAASPRCRAARASERRIA